MSRSVQTTAPVMSDAELHKSLERVERIHGTLERYIYGGGWLGLTGRHARRAVMSDVAFLLRVIDHLVASSEGMVQGDVLRRTITTSGPDTYVETGWPRDKRMIENEQF